MAFQQEPDNIVWCVLTDGRFVGMTYRREEQVVGWHEHIIGGSFGSGNSVVESVAVVPGDLNEDNVYLVVKRTINGATARYIETFSSFDFGTDVEDAFFSNFLPCQVSFVFLFVIAVVAASKLCRANT